MRRSREKVIWNEHTKAYIQKLILEATDEASEMIESELEEEDFLKWIKACRDITSKAAVSSGHSALRQISKIIDTSNLKPRFPKNKLITFQGVEYLLKGYNVRKVSYTYDLKDKDKPLLGKEVKISTEPMGKFIINIRNCLTKFSTK